MRPRGVVVAAPCFDPLAGVPDRSEPVLIEAFVPEPTVERLDEGVLHRLAGFNEPQGHTGPFGPFEHGTRGPLGAVVEDDLLWQAEAFAQIIKEPGEPSAGDRHIDDLTGAELAVIINDVENAEPPIIGKLIAHEIQRPALHRPVRHSDDYPIPPRQLTPLLGPHLKSFGPVEPIGALGVLNEPLAFEQHMQPQIAVAFVGRGQSFHPVDGGVVVPGDGPVLLHRPGKPDDAAGPALGQIHRLLEKAHGFALCHGLHQFFASSSFIAVRSSI